MATLYAVRATPGVPPLDDDEVVDEMAHGYGCLDAAITLWRLVDPARAESLRALLVRVAAASDRYTRFAGDDLAALIQMLSGVGAALQAAGIVDEHCRIPPEHLDELKRHVPAMDLELNRPLHCKTAALVEVIVLTRAVLTEVLAERAWPGPLRLDDYLPDGTRHLWPGLAEHFALQAPQPTVDEVVERLILNQSVETARCIQDGVVKRPQDADVGAVLGWGYPSLRGGPIGWIHTMGVPQFVAACDRLADCAGARFTPPPLLREMAQTGRTFYS